MNRTSIALLSATLVAACAFLLLQPARYVPVASGVVPTAEYAPLTQVRFQPMALRWGVAAAHQQGAGKLTGLTETMGAGLCVLDANGDHWPDLFFVGGSGNRRHYGDASWWYRGAGNRLFLNRGGQGFVDATEDWGLDAGGWGMGCVAADLDGDSHPELLVYGRGPNLLYRHTGDRFTLDETIAALQEDRWTLGASVGDFNRDGRPDIYLSNYIDYRKGDRTFEAFSGFDVAEDAAFESTLYDAQANQLLVNGGELRFDEQAEVLGVNNAQGRSLGARWLELNDDGWPDLLVMNQHGTPNAVFINNLGRGFTPASRAFAPLALGGSRDMQLTSRDGAQEFFFTRGAGFINALISQQDTLVDVTRSRGLGLSSFFGLQSWGAVAADFNNDGFEDLYVANGQLRPDADARHLSTGQPDSLLLGQARGFVQTPAAGEARRFVSSRAVVQADFDGDGLQDLAVSGNNSPLAILRNITAGSGHWLRVVLPPAERDSSRVRLVSEGAPRELRPRSAGGFLAQSEPVLHFGLGAASTASLEVIWRDGSRTRHTLDRVDRTVLALPDGQLRDIALVPLEQHETFDSLDALPEDSLQPLAQVALLLDRHPLLRAIFERGPSVLQRDVLLQLTRDHGLLGMQLLEAGLHVEEPAVVTAALSAAQRLEYERSIDWIIEIFSRDDAGLICQASAVLEHFYEQEEATIRRKYLAVPGLMQLLNRPSVAPCAARALGAAEKKRAVPALLYQLEISTDEALREEIIRSLGLIRDTSALAPLTSLPGSATAREVAASLVARVRLGDTLENGLLGLHGLPRAEQLDVLAYAFLNHEAAVLSPAPLQERLATLLAQPDDDDGLSAIRAMAASAQPGYAAALQRATQTGNPEQRATAYAGLARLGARRELATLSERDLTLVRRVLSDVPDLRLDVSGLARLLDRGFPARELETQLARLSADNFGMLLGQMAASGTVVTEPVLSACSRTSGVVNPQAFQNLPLSMQFSDVALDCFFGRAGDAVRQRDQIARRLVIRNVLTDLPQQDQRRLRQKLASRDSFYADATLFEPLSSATADSFLAFLATEPGARAVPELAQLARDPRLDIIVRTRALELLAARDAKQASLVLQGLLK